MMGNNGTLKQDGAELRTCGKIVEYSCGVVDIIAASTPTFMPPGWEARGKEGGQVPPSPRQKGKASEGVDAERSMRRAKARVRSIALENRFTWFVTLTLSPEKVDRYDGKAVVKKLNAWLSNQVARSGLAYVLVPERHKDGALHFHGFFNDALAAVPSGHYDGAGHEIFNLPQWTLGFTAAIKLYGDYPCAVAYVTKYIGKQGDKPCGRWYYSGGALALPNVHYVDIDTRSLCEDYPDAYTFDVPGKKMAKVTILNERNSKNGTTEHKTEIVGDGV